MSVKENEIRDNRANALVSLGDFEGEIKDVFNITSTDVNRLIDIKDSRATLSNFTETGKTNKLFYLDNSYLALTGTTSIVDNDMPTTVEGAIDFQIEVKKN